MHSATISFICILCMNFSRHAFAAALVRSAHSTNLTRRHRQDQHGAAHRREAPSTSISNRAQGRDYSLDLLWGNDSLSMLIDTGSSDLWVAQSNFTCLEKGRRPTYRGYCGFGGYVKGFDAGQIKDEAFTIDYGGGGVIHGTLGYEDITVAGIEVKHQEAAIAYKAIWSGDNVTAGLMGLGYPVDTSATRNGSTIQYFPWFFSAFHRGLISPMFSLALQRGGNDEHAGQIAFGGLPDLDFSPEFTSVPIKTYPELGNRPFAYRINIDGWVVDDVFLPENGTARTYLVDSGNPGLLVSNHIAATVNSKFSQHVNLTQGIQWELPCNATSPKVAVRISGHDLPIDPRDLVEPSTQGYFPRQTGYCLSGFQNGYGYNILGDTFLKNVVAVFDVGAVEMRFAPHRY